MKIGETIDYNGNSYTAVEYTQRPADFFPTGDDDQCRLCQLAPNFCKMMDECHGVPAFVFAKTEHVKMMEGIKDIF